MKALAIEKTIPRKRNNFVDQYLKEINKASLISPDEEIALSHQIKKGNIVALQSLATANLRFVFAVAKQFQNQGLDLLDLINEGNYGLMKAAENFNESFGVKFISYAVWHIRNEILEALDQNKKIVPVSLGYRRIMKRIERVQSSHLTEFGTPPSSEYISEKIGKTVMQVEDTMRYFIGEDKSLDESFNYDTKGCLLDVIENQSSLNPEKELISQSLKIEIKNMLKTLNQQESAVISMYFGIGLQPQTVGEIATRLNLKEDRVKEIKLRTLKKLRNNPSRISILKKYYADMN